MRENIRHMGSFFKRIENMFFEKHIVPILLRKYIYFKNQTIIMKFLYNKKKT